VTHWSDKALVKRILKGDREACARMVRSHYAPIFRFLGHLSRNAHSAEDLTQETFAAAWGNIGDFAGASSLRTWLHRIAYRKFIDFCRRKDHSLSGVDNGEIDRLEARQSNPLEEALTNDESGRLIQAVECLKPAERTVIVLHYLQSLSFREVAEVTGEPQGTVRWRASCALRNLRNRLDGRAAHEC
jgi:RNA polymerase sigma-70 factor, ECF subfamily